MANLRDIVRELIKDNEEIYSTVCVVSEVDKDKRVCRAEPVDGSAELFDVRLQSKVSDSIGLVLFPVIGSNVTVTFLSKELAFVSQTSEIEEVLLKIGEFSLFMDAENFNKSVKNVTINTETYEKTATDTKITTQNYDLIGENAKFELSTLFEVVSNSDLSLQALSMVLQASNIDITGVVNINGATTINGAATISGAVSMGGGSNGGVPRGSSIVEELNNIIAEVNKIRNAFVGWTPVNNDGGAALKARVSGLNSLPNVQENNITNPNALH